MNRGYDESTNEKILFINACPRPQSRTLLLAQEILPRLNGSIEELDLYREDLLPLDLKQLERRNLLISANNFDDPMFRYARQFADADQIVIAAPYWDLAFPSIVRIYFEHITVTGLTFAYSPEGIPFGLCRVRRLAYITTAGGPVGDLNLGYDYVKAICSKFYGIPETVCIKAENLDIQGAPVDQILQETVRRIPESFF